MNSILNKTLLLGIPSVIAGSISTLFGGWSGSLTTLIILMGIDYITGIIVAAVFKKSPQTSTGALESNAGWKGLCKKGIVLSIILICIRLDMLIGTPLLKDCVTIAYIINESISIIENAGLIGIPIPKVIFEAIDILKNNNEKNN